MARCYSDMFTNYFTANSTVTVEQFITALVNKYGEGFVELSFIWSNGNQGYITDGNTPLLINGNFFMGHLRNIDNWTRMQFLMFDINRNKVFVVTYSKDSSSVTTSIIPLN